MSLYGYNLLLTIPLVLMIVLMFIKEPEKRE